MKNTYLLLILCFLLSCSSKQQKLSVLDFEQAISNPENISFEDYIKDVKYVALETTDKSLVSGIGRCVITKENIFISNYDKLCSFTKSGKFIRQIGSPGRGPEEFQFLMDISFDYTENQICICDEGLIVRYTADGEFVSRRKILGLGVLPTFKINSKGNYYCKRAHGPNESIALDVYDKDFNLLKSFKNSIVRKSGGRYQPFISMHNDAVYYNSYVNDTIFSVDANLNKKANWLIDYGKYKVSKHNMEIIGGRYKGGYLCTDLFIGGNLNIFSIRTKGSYAGFILHFKNTNKLICPKDLNLEKYLSIKMNGLEWQIERFCNGKLVMSIDAIELLENVDKIEDVELKNIALNITEESNPVMAIIEV